MLLFVTAVLTLGLVCTDFSEYVLVQTLVKGGKLLGPGLVRDSQRRELSATVAYDMPGGGVDDRDLGDLEDYL